MPRGAKPGERRGGRRRGSRNKATIEREIRETQRVLRISQTPPGERILAVGVIEHFMQIALDYAGKYKAAMDHAVEHPDEVAELAMSEKQEDKTRLRKLLDGATSFQEWARLAVDWAGDLAPYQSPTFRAISMSPQSQERDREDGKVVLNTVEAIREQLILHGVAPDQIGRVLKGPPPLIEHDPAEKKG